MCLPWAARNLCAPADKEAQRALVAPSPGPFCSCWMCHIRGSSLSSLSVHRSVCITLAEAHAPHNASVCSLLRWGSERKRVLLPSVSRRAPNESWGSIEAGSGWSTRTIPSPARDYFTFFCVIYLMKEESKVDSAAAYLMNKIRCGTPLAQSFTQGSGVVSEPIFTSSLQCWHAQAALIPLEHGVPASA